MSSKKPSTFPKRLYACWDGGPDWFLSTAKKPEGLISAGDEMVVAAVYELVERVTITQRIEVKVTSR